MKVIARSYMLKNEDNSWLGQVVITSDGMFSSVTDWGNFSFAWRSYNGDFREFLISLDTQYFANKMYLGSFTSNRRKHQAICDRFSEKILPPLQLILRKELKEEVTKIDPSRDYSRTCRVCGCTDEDCRQCIQKTGSPCWWVEDDLCSACDTLDTFRKEMKALRQGKEE